MRPPGTKKLRYSEDIIETIRLTRRAQKYEELENLTDRNQRIFLDSAQYWLQIGYNKARVRYPNPNSVISVFQTIEQLVDARLRYAEEGERFLISYNVAKHSASLKELEPDYY